MTHYTLIIRSLLYLFFSLVIISPVFSDVNKKNGNFFISYTDLTWESENGAQYEILRTYNSKSTYKGLFGYGWSSKIETRLFNKGDGSILIYHHGGGTIENFTQNKRLDDIDLRDDILSVIESITDKELEDTLLEKLESDNELQDSYLSYYRKKNIGQRGKVEIDDVLWGSKGIRYLIRTASGYIMVDVDKNYMFFDHDGKLLRMNEFGGADYSLIYNRDGKLVFISLDSRNGWSFKYRDGSLYRITDILSNKYAQYTIREEDLGTTINLGGTIFKYDYDSNHNMTAIRYRDGSVMYIEYEDKSQFASKITTRNGDTTEYRYYGKSSFDYGTEVIKTVDGVENYEDWRYVIAHDSLGYTYEKVLQVTMNDHTIGIEKNSNGVISGLLLGLREERLDFEYNNRKELVQISGKNILVNYKYDDTGLKTINYSYLSSYASIDYSFDSYGNISLIETSDGAKFLTKFRSESILEEVQITLPNKYSLRYEYDIAGNLEAIFRNGELVENIDDFLIDIENDIWENFFEFYQFYKRRVKIFYEGIFQCGECQFGFYSQLGRIARLSKE